MCHITAMGSDGSPVYIPSTPAQKAAFESSPAGQAATQPPGPGADRVSFSPEAMAALGG